MNAGALLAGASDGSARGRVFAIVPAAGKSRRMGGAGSKLLLPWGQSSVLETVLAAYHAAGVNACVAVAARDQAGVAGICQKATPHVVMLPGSPPEMKDTVKAALDYIRGHFSPAAQDAWLLAPADMPTLSATAVSQLLAARQSAADEILVAAYQGKRGHPVLFPWSVAERVNSLAKDQGVNQLLREFPTRLVEVGAGALAGDMDTPEEYLRLYQQTFGQMPPAANWPQR